MNSTNVGDDDDGMPNIIMENKIKKNSSSSLDSFWEDIFNNNDDNDEKTEDNNNKETICYCRDDILNILCDDEIIFENDYDMNYEHNSDDDDIMNFVRQISIWNLDNEVVSTPEEIARRRKVRVIRR